VALSARCSSGAAFSTSARSRSLSVREVKLPQAASLCVRALPIAAAPSTADRVP
jgi:Tfp pilus assembly protein PilV